MFCRQRERNVPKCKPHVQVIVLLIKQNAHTIGALTHGKQYGERLLHVSGIREGFSWDMNIYIYILWKLTRMQNGAQGRHTQIRKLKGSFRSIIILD